MSVRKLCCTRPLLENLDFAWFRLGNWRWMSSVNTIHKYIHKVYEDFMHFEAFESSTAFARGLVCFIPSKTRWFLTVTRVAARFLFLWGAIWAPPKPDLLLNKHEILGFCSVWTFLNFCPRQAKRGDSGEFMVGRIKDFCQRTRRIRAINDVESPFSESVLATHLSCGSERF